MASNPNDAEKNEATAAKPSAEHKPLVADHIHENHQAHDHQHGKDKEAQKKASQEQPRPPVAAKGVVPGPADKEAAGKDDTHPAHPEKAAATEKGPVNEAKKDSMPVEGGAKPEDEKKKHEICAAVKRAAEKVLPEKLVEKLNAVIAPQATKAVSGPLQDHSKEQSSSKPEEQSLSTSASSSFQRLRKVDSPVAPRGRPLGEPHNSSEEDEEDEDADDEEEEPEEEEGEQDEDERSNSQDPEEMELESDEEPQIRQSRQPARAIRRRSVNRNRGRQSRGGRQARGRNSNRRPAQRSRTRTQSRPRSRARSRSNLTSAARRGRRNRSRARRNNNNY